VAQPAVGVARSCGPRFENETVFTCDGVNLAFVFRPLNGVTGHLCHGLPSCQFSASVLVSGSGTGQTDDHTDDGHQRLMPPPYGGHNNAIVNA